MHRIVESFITGLILLSLVFSPLSAEEQDEKTNSPKTDTAEKKARSEVSDTDRDAALKFADENHPELGRLLKQLQKSRPAEFSRAIKELSQQVQNLERTKERNLSRYQVQLESWKQDSQIRVLLARWSRSQDADLEKQTRELLRKRQEARIAQLKAEKERLQEHQRKIDEQLAALAAPIDSLVDQEWDQLSRKAGAKKDVDKKKSDKPNVEKPVVK